MYRMFIIAAVFLVGCASAPDGAMNYDQVEIPEPTDKESVFVFYRLYTPPLAYEMRVSVDGKQVASLPNNSFSYVKLAPGKFELKTSWTAWAMMPSKKQELEIQPNQKLFLQLNSSVWTPTGIELGYGKSHSQQESEATAKLKECCKYIEQAPL